MPAVLPQCSALHKDARQHCCLHPTICPESVGPAPEPCHRPPAPRCPCFPCRRRVAGGLAWTGHQVRRTGGPAATLRRWIMPALCHDRDLQRPITGPTYASPTSSPSCTRPCYTCYRPTPEHASCFCCIAVITFSRHTPQATGNRLDPTDAHHVLVRVQCTGCSLVLPAAGSITAPPLTMAASQYVSNLAVQGFSGQLQHRNW